MSTCIIFSPARREMAILGETVAFLLKRHGIRELPVRLEKTEQLRQRLDAGNVPDMAVCDVTVSGILPLLEQLRGSSSQLKLVLVADNTINPVSYIRPTILPTALLWRPIEPEQTGRTLWEVVSALPRQEEAEENQELFRVEIRSVVKQFPYKDILFFESRDKKLFLHCQRSQIPFPGTLERLQEELPQDFMRVHKSFIINKTKVAQVQYGQSLIILEDGMEIPISRSYKAEVKAVFA